MRCALLFVVAAAPAFADPPSVVSVEAVQNGETWRFDVTLRHPDTGWAHYADGWRIETIDGSVLGTRELLHPHVSEQPFTRSLNGVSIPSDTDGVAIRAKCSVDGWADFTQPINVLP